MSILSIQSHVSYGYVGNRAAVFPLQSLGYDVWTINTVHFSNHTGYPTWQGTVCKAAEIEALIEGLKHLGIMPKCRAILSGYMGNDEIGQVILNAVREFKVFNPNLLYLCDPVMGERASGFYVKPPVFELYRDHAVSLADVLTPNHFEAEQLSGITIQTLADAKAACQRLHAQGTKIVLITSLELAARNPHHVTVLMSTPTGAWIAHTPYVDYSVLPSGTGDLLAALFLGYYLQHQNPEESLQQTLLAIYQVIQTTYAAGEHELQVIHGHYQEPPRSPDVVLSRC